MTWLLIYAATGWAIIRTLAWLAMFVADRRDPGRSPILRALAAGLEFCAAACLWILIAGGAAAATVVALGVWGMGDISGSASAASLSARAAEWARRVADHWGVPAAGAVFAVSALWMVARTRRAHRGYGPAAARLAEERTARRYLADPGRVETAIEPARDAKRLRRAVTLRQFALQRVEPRLDGGDFVIFAPPQGRAAQLRDEIAALDAAAAALRRLADQETAARKRGPAADAAPDKTSREQFSPEQSSPAQTAPEQTSPKQTSAKQTSAKQTSPKQSSPDQAALEQARADAGSEAAGASAGAASPAQRPLSPRLLRARRRRRRRRALARLIAALVSAPTALDTMSTPARAGAIALTALSAAAAAPLFGPAVSEALDVVAAARAEELRTLRLAATRTEANATLAAVADALEGDTRMLATAATPDAAGAGAQSEATRRAPPPRAAVVAPEDAVSDAAVADALARLFESDAAPKGWLSAADVGDAGLDAAGGSTAGLTAEGLAAARTWRADRTRETLIRARAARARAVAATAAAPIGSPAADEASLVRQSLAAPAPVTEIGRRAAARYLALAGERPALWARLRGRMAEISARFGREAPPQSPRGLAVSRALAAALAPAQQDAPGDAEQDADANAARQATAASVDAYLDAAFATFTAEIAATGDLAAASARAAAVAPLAAPPADAARLAAAAQAPAEADAVLARARAAGPRLVALRRPTADPLAAAAAAERLAAPYAAVAPAPAPGAPPPPSAPLALSEPFAAFADYFPARLGDERTTWRAEISRALNLRDAPPSTETWRLGVAQAARTRRLAQQARAYDALRGYHRVGGVLLGRPPEAAADAPSEPPAPAFVDLSWELSRTALTLEFIRPDGAALTLGPFAPATALAALAYAADGRPVAATMVTATPLADLKILTHPALIDAPIGCRARRLDQFGDEVSRADPVLSARRAAVEAAADAEIALYRLAWARRVAAYARIAELGRGFEGPRSEEDADRAALRALRATLTDARLSAFGPIVNEAGEILRDPRLAEQAAAAFGATALDLSEKPAYFDRELVGFIGACRAAGDVEGFAGCLDAEISRSEAFNAWRLPAPADRADFGRLRWLAPPPRYEIWSGVRERPYRLDPALASLSQPEDAAWPFTFVLQLTFSSPAYFVDPFLPWWSPENAEIERHVDREPWAFGEIGAALTEAIAARAEAGGEVGEVLAEMRAFAVAQRLFRAALANQLGPTFPLGRLAALDAALTEATPPDIGATPTLGWNLRDGVVEAGFLRVLSARAPTSAATRSASGAAARCLAFAQARLGGAAFAAAATRGEGAGPLATISLEDWNAACGPARFVDPGLGALAEEVSAARALRSGLGMDVERRISARLARQTCPAP